MKFLLIFDTSNGKRIDPVSRIKRYRVVVFIETVRPGFVGSVGGRGPEEGGKAGEGPALVEQSGA